MEEVNDRDFLDDLIDERKAQSPSFAKKWAEAELRLDLALMRKESGMTQAEIAERMGVPQPRVAELEKHPARVSFGRILSYVNATGGRLMLVREEKEDYTP